MEKRLGLSAGLGGLAALTLAMFHDVLFATGTRVPGTAHGDLAMQFLPWRDFGFGELAKGNLALWNPHIYAGAPFFGGMQSALLYPPNWLYLVLPLAPATNWTIALNAWLLGAFIYLWALRRGVHPFAAFVAAGLFLFGAPHFLHVAAGHLSGLAAMPWIPLLFLAIDEWLASRRLPWCLVGMAAVALQILAGHPQYVYFTAIIAGVYALVRLAEPRAQRLALAVGLAGFYLGGAALAAVQLFPGFQAAGETIRGQPLPYWFAVMFNFPPENFITLFAPGFFGDMAHQPYWGRWVFWEANAYVGVLGLGLALYGMAASAVTGKRALLAALAASVVLALGDSTPLFRLLYDFVPLFDRFRGAAKFISLAALVLALFAGYGVDRLLRERTVSLGSLAFGAALAAGLFAGAFALRSVDWRAVMAAIHATGDSFVHAERYANAGFVSTGQSFASLGLVVAGVIAAAGVCLAFWVRREPRAAYVLGAAALAEIFAFASMHRPTFEASQAVLPELRQLRAADPGDYRVLDVPLPDSAMSLRAFDVWGYDPGVMRRYAEFIEWSGGGDPAQATQYQRFERVHPLLSMLRLKYLLETWHGKVRVLKSPAPPFGRLQLVGSYRLAKSRGEILQAMGQRSFDPAREMILETVPHPAPAGVDVPGRATLVREGTDFMDITADLSAPSLLLITDAWAEGWRARPLEGGSQQHYEVMPANYALRAIPLERGRHHFRVEYVPTAFRFGVIVSAVAWLAWLAALYFVLRRVRGAADA
jgi:hypothetical protein